MENVIKELKVERAALQDRLTRIDAAIADYERWAQSVEGLIGANGRLAAVEGQPRASVEQTPIKVFEEEVRALLDRVTAPLKRNEVHDALREAGVVVGGKDPLNTVASRLSRMEGVTNLKGLGYWRADRPFPQAGYSGEASEQETPSERAEVAKSENRTLLDGFETSGDAS